VGVLTGTVARRQMQHAPLPVASGLGCFGYDHIPTQTRASEIIEFLIESG
jgi:hypothetical protein